jgi:murein DD-endopeptidase MepM/ murein hydrolase activator NlpD
VPNARYEAGKHTGVDFGASGDDAIRCVAAGTVVTTDYDRDGWGNRVIVKHAHDRYSWYCHLASRAVDVGDSVDRGDKLGMMGETGNATGKHLHYQESLGGKRYDQFKKPVLLVGLAAYQG